MPAFTHQLREMLVEGVARLREPPRLADEERPEAVRLLASAFEEHRLGVAGPRLDFAATSALAAARFTAWACWFLVHRNEDRGEVEHVLALPCPPTCAADHLSADVVFRLLPGVHRRARAIDPRDVLTLRVEQTLRQWPLSGVLADLDEGPATLVDLGGHPGLCLLYAERLAARPRPSWEADGPTRPWVELVRAERASRRLP